MAETVLERHPGASARGGEVAAAAVPALDVARAAAPGSTSRSTFASAFAAALAAALACARAEAEVHGHHRLLVGLAVAVVMIDSISVIFMVSLMFHLDVVDVHGLALQEEQVV